MKFIALIAVSSSLLAVSALPTKRSVDPNLVPQFGFSAGKNPTGTGDCDGAVNGSNGQPIKIPCACPPDRNTFIADLSANVAAGHIVNNPGIGASFPTDGSVGSQIARLQTAITTLQNLHGPGVGCPVVSTTFLAQITALQQSGKPLAAAAPSAPAPAVNIAPAPPAASSGDAAVAALAPNLGFHSGVNPTGTGDCDGAVTGADGKPIKIPCSCPPSQAAFVTALQANVLAGEAVNNPSIKISFPLDNSKASQEARIEAALVTLQNLNGPGKGCPAVSSTLQAQQKAIQSGQSGAPAPAAVVNVAPAPPPAAAPAASTGDAAVAALAPNLGFHSGVNPTGTGDCDGAVNGANGKPIKVPCSCPPSQAVFISALQANVRAGKAIHNPSVHLSFPLDNSKASKGARIEAAIITIQNLNGPGVGCPVVSTTLLAQQAAV